MKNDVFDTIFRLTNMKKKETKGAAFLCLLASVMTLASCVDWKMELFQPTQDTGATYNTFDYATVKDGINLVVS